MKGGSPAETTQTTKVELPKWVEQAGKSNYEFAEKIAKGDMPVYGGQRVADQSNMTTDAYKYLMSNVGAQDPLFANANALNERAATENDPRFAQAQGILANLGTDQSWDPTKYLNPYTAEVESRAVDNAQRDLTRSLMAQSDKARKAGAFGGSASGIERGVLAAEGARGIGDLSAGLRRAGYDKATADMIADRELKRATAGDIITGATTQNQGWLEAAKGILATAAGRGSQVGADIAGMLGAGQQEQAFRQSQIESDMNKFYEKRDRKLERLNIRLAALGMTPYGKREETTKVATPATQGPDFATAGLGIAQLLMPMLSDRRDKKDVEKLGTDEATGLPIYAYRYKKDKGGPKTVGPMAQDVEKMFPHAVTEIGGHKVIIPGMLAA